MRKIIQKGSHNIHVPDALFTQAITRKKENIFTLVFDILNHVWFNDE